MFSAWTRNAGFIKQELAAGAKLGIKRVDDGPTLRFTRKQLRGIQEKITSDGEEDLFNRGEITSATAFDTPTFGKLACEKGVHRGHFLVDIEKKKA